MVIVVGGIIHSCYGFRVGLALGPGLDRVALDTRTTRVVIFLVIHHCSLKGYTPVLGRVTKKKNRHRARKPRLESSGGLSHIANLLF